MNQEPNNNPGLVVKVCIGFGQRRRSVRTYKKDEVKEDLIRESIDAATFAPSAKNGQQWRFTVLTGESKDKFTDMYRGALEKLTFDVGSSYGSCTMMEEAP